MVVSTSVDIGGPPCCQWATFRRLGGRLLADPPLPLRGRVKKNSPVSKNAAAPALPLLYRVQKRDRYMARGESPTR